jgi:hypothetical protein
VRMIRVFSAVSFIALAPCVVRGQNPAPAPAPPAPVERRVETRTVKMGPGMIRPMRLAVAGRHQMMMMMDAASMLLSHTGELQLTDAQVTKLAAIARRAEGREKAMHARMDSSMAMVMMHERAETPQHDGMAGAKAMMMMRSPMLTDAERKAQHEDDREAFSVATADQLATLWEMMSHHGR